MISNRPLFAAAKHWTTTGGRGFAILVLVLLAATIAVAGEQKGPALPPPAHEALFQAWQDMEKENYAAAMGVLEAFRKRRPGWMQRGVRDPEGYFHPLVDFYLANCHLALGRPQRAATLYEYTLAAQPEFAPAWINLGRACWEAQRFGLSARAFEHGYETSAHPQPELLYHAALAWRAGERPEKALESLQRLLARHGDQARMSWHELSANLYQKLGRLREALGPMRTLADAVRGERQRRWREVLLTTYLRLEMYTAARDLVDSLTRAEPEHPGWWRELARLQLRENRYAAALGALIIVDCLEALSAPEARLAGDLSLNLEVPLLSGRYYRQALEHDESLALYRRLVQSYRRLHCPEQALETVRRARRRYPGAGLLLLEGEILFDLEEYTAARKVLAELVAAAPENGRGWLLLGYAACNLSDYAGAREALDRAAGFPRQRVHAQRLIEQIERAGAFAGD